MLIISSDIFDTHYYCKRSLGEIKIRFMQLSTLLYKSFKV